MAGADALTPTAAFIVNLSCGTLSEPGLSSSFATAKRQEPPFLQSLLSGLLGEEGGPSSVYTEDGGVC